MAVPPPPPPPDPPSSDPLPQPTSFPSSKPQSPSSDLVRSCPDLAAPSSSAGQSSSVLRQSSGQQASAPPAAAGSSSGISAQPLNICPAFRASDIAAAGPELAVAGSRSGHLSSAQALPLHPPQLPAPSSPSSSCPAVDRAAAGSISAAVHPQIASALPLLASVLQSPAIPCTIPSSSSLPTPSQTATLQPLCLGSSMERSKVSLDTPQFPAAAQYPAPIESTQGVRPYASTKPISANPQPLPPPLNPPPPLSYAQVARHPRGSGFVRSHAVDVESFARLPRTGANIVCGSKEGIPSFSFVDSDLQTVENLYSNALIMKFRGGRPSLEASHREIQSWGLEHPFSIGPLSSRALLLRFQDNQDLIRVLTRPSSILITFSYKIFRWHNLCHLKDDSCYAPVWISLPRLPLQCFIPEFLESVANSIGRFLCFDKATTTLARPSAARLCVELDLRITPPPFIWVGLFDGLKQPIIYEKMPKYCGECHIQGHLAITCPKGQRETPNIQAIHRTTMNRACPPPARQNVVEQVSVLQQQPNPSAALSPNSQLPPPPNPPSTSLPTASPLLYADAARQQHTPIDAAFTSDPSIHRDADAARHHSQLTTLHSPSPSVSLLQRAPDAASPNVLPQAQPPTDLLQQALLQPQPTATLLQQNTAAAEPADAHPPAQPTATMLQRDSAAAAPSAGLESPHRSASQVQRGSLVAATPLLPPDPLAISTHSSSRMAPYLPHPPPPLKPVPSTSSKSLKGKHKSIKSKPPDVDISSSLSQQQQVALKQQRAALENFKSKLHPSQIGGHHLNSVNHFQALRYDHSDVEGDGDVASYYSDTDDGGAEHIDLGYQSANGRSSNKLKDFAPSGMRINKRHPNMPLRVKLRSRKDSHPSTP